MRAAPLVSIVLPVFNDEATVAATLESCLAQTLAEIEVICVDDASTDATVDVLERFRDRDDRVRVVRHDTNLSAFQARRSGIVAASAEHLLFVDGDDELLPDACAKALAKAQETGADLVGFGVVVVEKDGRTGGAYEARLQPRHHSLEGAEAVLGGLFPIGKPAQGQLWRCLYRTQVLRDAYALLPDDLALPRVNDLPLLFLAAAVATSYVSITDKLYRYHFGRGGSGHDVDSVERAAFYTSAIDSIDAIRPAVEQLASTHAAGALLLEVYESARLSIVGYVCFQLIERSDSAILDAALAHLHTRASAHDVVHAAARFYPATLKTLKFHTAWQGLGDRAPETIMIATSNIRTGGVSAVVTSQARYLQASGFRVIVVARNPGTEGDALSLLPEGVAFVQLASRELADRLQEWGAICREHSVDVVIDHQVLYTPYWPEYALMARAEGAATIGWIHNFIARPVYDGNGRLSLIERCSNTLAQIVTLSPLDVAYFKLRGIEHAAYVPNPPSPLLVESTGHAVVKHAPTNRIELVWWGRLEQRTKQVYELIEVGVELRRLDVDFHLTVVGPDWDDVTAKKFNALARQRRVHDQVVAVGPRRGADLVAAIDAADAFVTTSIIEGYQLTIAEAQARGLPVFMYELPWLTLVQNNDGIVAVPQGDAASLARKIADLMGDTARYQQLSQASVTASHRATSYDFAHLYRGVVTGTLPEEYSPEPTSADARQLLGLMVFFAERTRRAARQRVQTGSSLGVRLWQSIAPVGRATLKRMPGLRPLAHRAKGWMRAR